MKWGGGGKVTAKHSESTFWNTIVFLASLGLIRTDFTMQ